MLTPDCGIWYSGMLLSFRLSRAKIMCSLEFAQNRGFCAKEETQCSKRARRAVHGLRERGICVDERTEKSYQ